VESYVTRGKSTLDIDARGGRERRRVLAVLAFLSQAP
jgi:hypothetical protein